MEKPDPSHFARRKGSESDLPTSRSLSVVIRPEPTPFVLCTPARTGRASRSVVKRTVRLGILSSFGIPSMAFGVFGAPGSHPTTQPLTLGPDPLSAQVQTQTQPQAPQRASPSAPSEWDSPEARALLELGRAARAIQADDGFLSSYAALTEGHIYFYVDSDEGDQALIRVDQVAVELFWEAPDLVRQRIVGERSETRLPVRDFRYYLDRLTLVQYGFGNEIEVGQGMDVARVPHPLAPAPFAPAPTTDRADVAAPSRPTNNAEPYRVRLGEVVTLFVPGLDAPVRVRELEVEPRDPSRPGVIGTLFLDESDGQLVRLAIGFTPASYQDPRTDRITVTLDYGLWEGRVWLPNRQELEVRREIPEFDVGVGTVIRTVLRVGNYDLNAPMPLYLRGMPGVTAAPRAERAEWTFREGLFDALVRDGLEGVRTRVDPAALRGEAQSRLFRELPSGLSPLRLSVAGVSDVFRADRARGVTLGAGASWRPMAGVRARSRFGYAAAGGYPTGRIELDRGPQEEGGVAWGVEAGLNEIADLGLEPAVPGILGTLSTLLFGEDYVDPWRRSGVRVRATLTPRRSGAWGLGLAGAEVVAGIGIEQHRSDVLRWDEAPGRLPFVQEGASRPRPVTSINEGTFFVGSLSVRRRIQPPAPFALPGIGQSDMRLHTEALWGSNAKRVQGVADLEHRRQSPIGAWDASVRMRGGTGAGDDIVQQTPRLGGRETLPGLPFRSIAAPHWTLVSLEGSADARPGSPWVRLRVGGVLGWTEAGSVGSVRAGVGLYYNILRIEGAQGFGSGGETQLLISIDPLWWRWL